MKINHAILHVFDFQSCTKSFSGAELDLDDRRVKRYVGTQARRALRSIDGRHGTFNDDSVFADELRRYFSGQDDFVGLSTRVGDFLSGELGHMEKPASTDLLVVDFDEKVRPDAVHADGLHGETSDDAAQVSGSDSDAGTASPFEDDDAELGAYDADADDAGLGTDDADLDAAFEGRTKRYLALILLEIKPVYVHETEYGSSDHATNEIVYRQAVMPNPSQKVSSYAVIEADSLDIILQEKLRDIAGEEKMLLADGLLRCDAGASAKEAFQAVTDVVEDLADEFGQNSAVALSKAKYYASEHEDECFDTEEMAREIFGDDTVQQRRFSEAIEEGTLPDQMRMDHDAAKRITRSHKIRTSTGIVLTFPSEYCKNPDLIEFIEESDGTMSIELRHIDHIENA